MPRVGPSSAGGGPSMAVIFSPGGPIILLQTVQGDHSQHDKPTCNDCVGIVRMQLHPTSAYLNIAEARNVREAHHVPQCVQLS